MAVPVYSPHEIYAIAAAAEVVSRAIDAALELCKPGVTTREVNDTAESVFRGHDAEPLFIAEHDGADPFGHTSCVCVNEEVVCARPGTRELREGDLVTLDIGARLDGWCADLARTIVVEPGGADQGITALADAAPEVTRSAIGALGSGVLWSSVAAATRSRARELGVHLIDGYAGHGIGRTLHEAPTARIGPSEVARDTDFTLRPGMVFTVEPIVCTRPVGTVLDADGWTVRTRDGSRACYEERMVAITRAGPRILG